MGLAERTKINANPALPYPEALCYCTDNDQRLATVV